MQRHPARSSLIASFVSAAFVLAACGGGKTDTGPVTYPAVGTVDGSEDEQVFVPGQVLTYSVQMSPDDRQYMEEHGVDEDTWLTATLTVSGDGKTSDLGAISIRHKGGYGTLDMCWGPADPAVVDDPNTPADEVMLSRVRYQDADHSFCRKISYKLKFGKKQPFHGLKKLNLHSGSRDPTMLHDMMAYSLFYDFGVDAPRTAPARLYINDSFMGFFIAVEDVDDVYAKNHYTSSAGGNLYKEIWPDPEKKLALGDASYTSQATEQLQEGPGPVDDFLDLTGAVQSAVQASSVEPLRPQVNVDDLLRYIAVDRAIKNWDGITAMYTDKVPSLATSLRWPHNYYWYHATGDAGLFHLVPWDMDNTFQSSDPYLAPDPSRPWEGPSPIPNWNVKPKDCRTPRGVWNSSSWVVPSGCDPFLNLLASTQWPRFKELGDELLAGPLQTRTLQQKARAWASLIEPLVEEDPVIDHDTWKREKDALINDILVRMPGEFQALVDEGYVVEP